MYAIPPHPILSGKVKKTEDGGRRVMEIEVRWGEKKTNPESVHLDPPLQL